MAARAVFLAALLAAACTPLVGAGEVCSDGSDGERAGCQEGLVCVGVECCGSGICEKHCQARCDSSSECTSACDAKNCPGSTRACVHDVD